jgi:hypothetical protein
MRTFHEKFAVCFFALVALYHNTPVFVGVILHEENLLTASSCIPTPIWRADSARCELEADRLGFGWDFLQSAASLLDSILLEENKLSQNSTRIFR